MDSVAVSGQLSPLRIVRVSQSDGRVSVPVKPSHTVFAQFRHVSGTPASAGENTVPISRLFLLNRIVSMLQARKKHLVSNSGLAGLQQTEIKEYGAVSSQVKAGLILNFSA
ncbi:hypothetical protein S1OALGB6SA_554 [Olavius algarvensis spirochete endosymbiont]|uniref:hypothetical protein n=1 Tax=Olavius algarvensis spirochete endosymbiont TaxID=260710 RepID=UPI000F146ACC|nr:hypothetical protein [Olavius algarvensis spirochete endosymbiont]CAD7838625.1 MAG: hypothetical protein [Olavius algarvensis spirochete endosymbiont]VDA99486.1 hypothetical protein S1OALGB6SA_554 [Olavius algarvensis spirochete endosymbiont]